MSRDRRSRGWAAALIALVLLVRLSVPAGWMPDGNGLSIMLCPGAGAPVAAPMAMHHEHSMAMDMPMEMAGKVGDPQQHDDGQSHECPFAPNAAQLNQPEALAVAWVSTLTEDLAAPIVREAGVGRGLAAPPPPPTGPPSLV